MHRSARKGEREDWQFDPKLFSECARVAAAEGLPFTMDGAAGPDNAQLNRFVTRQEDFRKQKLTGESIWLNAPFSCDGSFLKHYLTERERAQGETALMAVVPVWK